MFNKCNMHPLYSGILVTLLADHNCIIMSVLWCPTEHTVLVLKTKNGI